MAKFHPAVQAALPRLLLKWPGGKRWLFAKLAPLFKVECDRFVEPFAGSAAAFFALQPRKALLSDKNEDLVECYRAVKHDPGAVWRRMKAHHRCHARDPGYYYRIRDSAPRSRVGRAARFIYLNRTCFNGIYRVNLDGVFNVPKGSKDTVIFPDDNFQKISDILRNAKIKSSDFEETLSVCGRGDLVFVDPPYTVKHNMNGFVKYNEKIFSWSDQVRLSGAILAAARRGARVILTNAAHESVESLYCGSGELNFISRQSVMAANSEKRSSVDEMVVLFNFDSAVRDQVSHVLSRERRFIISPSNNCGY